MPRLLEALEQEGVQHWENWAAFPCLLTATLTPDQAQTLSSLPFVKEVERDIALEISGRTLVNGAWGVDRIDQRQSALNHQFSATPRGEGVRVFVVDTGLRMDHQEFATQMAPQGQHWDFERTDQDPLLGWPLPGDDHGTHLASVIAGNTLGVAPRVTLHSIRVARSDSQVYPSNVLAGLQAALSLHNSLGGPSLINLSLSGLGRLTVFDDVMATLIQAGITVVVSVGNNSARAYDYWPANAGTRMSSQGTFSILSARKPITVGSIGRSIVLQNQRRDPMSPTSNWGSAVDILAPGEAVLGGGSQDATALVEMSGTSVAAAHVTGVLALYLEVSPNETPANLRNLLISRSTKGLVLGNETQAELTPNRIANSWWMPTTFEWASSIDEFKLDLMETTTRTVTLQAVCRIGQDNEDITYSVGNIRAGQDSIVPQGFQVTTSTRRVNGSSPYQFTTMLDLNLKSPELQSNQTVLLDIQASDQRGQTLTRTFTVTLINASRAPVWKLPEIRDVNTLGEPNIFLEIIQDTEIVPVEFLAEDPDGLEVTYTILAGTLPAGLVFDGNTLSGKPDVLPKDITLYELIFRATNTYGVSTDTTLYIQPADLNLEHGWRAEWLSSYPVETAPLELGGNVSSVFLGELTMGTPIHLLLELSNPDRDVLRYELLGAGVNNPDQETLLPVGLQLNQEGQIIGIPSLNNPAGKYYFRVKVEDTVNSGNPDTEGVVFHFDLLVNDSVDTSPTDFVVWDTPAGNLGTVFETQRCHVGVKAHSPGGGQVIYRLAPGLHNRLPSGLTLDQATGEIRGVVPFKTNAPNPVFVVRAQVDTAVSDRKFSFNIQDLYDTPTVMDVVGDLGGLARGKLAEWIQNVSGVDERLVFRPDDPLWGRVRLPKLYIVNGLRALHYLDSVNSYLFMEQLRDYHHKLELRFSTMKVARAQAPDGTYLYDVIYFQIEDPMKKAGGWNALDQEVELDYSRPPLEVPEWNLGAGNNRFFPNSLMNIRRDLIVCDSESRTSWTRQPDQDTTVVVETDYSGSWDAVGHSVAITGEQDIESDRFMGLTAQDVVVLLDDVVVPVSNYAIEGRHLIIEADAGTTLSIFPRRRGVGLAGAEGLPLWMQTEQVVGDITSIPGYTPAVEVLYCQPGKGNRVLAQLQAAGLNEKFQGQPFTVDRYLVNGYGIQRDGELGSSGGLPTGFVSTGFDEGLEYSYELYYTVPLPTNSFVIQIIQAAINKMTLVERERSGVRTTLTNIRLEDGKILIDDPLLAGDIVVLSLEQNGQGTGFDDSLNLGSDALTDDGKYYKFPNR